LAIRIYLLALTLVFLIATWLNGGVNVLTAIIVICALVYLILDAREHLQLVKTDVELLQQLEKKLSAFLH
jgi:hypothetical protein